MCTDGENFYFVFKCNNKLFRKSDIDPSEEFVFVLKSNLMNVVVVGTTEIACKNCMDNKKTNYVGKMILRSAVDNKLEDMGRFKKDKLVFGVRYEW